MKEFKQVNNERNVFVIFYLIWVLNHVTINEVMSKLNVKMEYLWIIDHLSNFNQIELNSKKKMKFKWLC